MRRIVLLALLLLFVPAVTPAQSLSDTIRGRIRHVREKLVFLDSTIQNWKLWGTEGDYGHYGFVDPGFTLQRFWQAWHHLPFVHYVNYERWYNESGQLAGQTWFTKKDEAAHRYEYGYDTAGNRVLEREYLYDSLFSTKQTFYLPDGRPLSTLEYFTGDRARYYYSCHRYDEKGNLAETREFDEYGESFGTRYVRDSLHRVVRELTHSPTVYLPDTGRTLRPFRDGIGVDYPRKHYVYDEKGRVIQEGWYAGGAGDNISYLRNRTWYRYDSKGRKVLEGYGKDSVESFREYQYNEPGQRTRETYRSGSGQRIIYSIHYDFDREGNIIQTIYRGEPADAIMTYRYVFDKKGNWTEQVKIMDGRPLFRLIREIAYYD